MGWGSLYKVENQFLPFSSHFASSLKNLSYNLVNERSIFLISELDHTVYWHNLLSLDHLLYFMFLSCVIILYWFITFKILICKQTFIVCFSGCTTKENEVIFFKAKALWFNTSYQICYSWYCETIENILQGEYSKWIMLQWPVCNYVLMQSCLLLP